MSEFKVEIVKIDSVEDVPNSDKLSLVKIGLFNCISGKLEDGTPRYKAGDLVAYIPEAAIMPDWMLQKMDFWKDGKGTLSGSKGNRVKAIKLRGVVSQGILYGTVGNSGLFGETTYKDDEDFEKVRMVNEGDDVADFLGITKYEPEVPAQMRGKVGSLFGYTKSYDIENFQKHNKVFSDGEEVVATEKLHGTLCQVGYIYNLPEDKKANLFPIDEKITAYVTSKGMAKSGLIQQNTDDNQNNIYVKAYQTFFTGKVADVMTGMFHSFKQATNVYVFGEVYGKGVQDLDYGTEPTFKVFDVYIKRPDDEFYLDDDLLDYFCETTGLERVPVLYRGPFSLEKMNELRSGNTVEGNGKHIREGIVIRPVTEREYRGLPDNRVQVKFIGEEYALRKNGTEYT